MPVFMSGLVREWGRNILYESRGLRPVGIYHGEFDPGSERTLAACLKHASRAARAAMLLERRTGE